MISQDPRRSTLDPLLNRRTLMLRALGASVALGSAGSLLAACGGGGGSATAEVTEAPPATGAAETTGAQTGAAAGEPKRGGTIRFAAATAFRGFDPHKWWDGWTWAATVAYTDSLLLAKGGQLAPGIAEIPEISNDGTLYTFKLKPGVMFHHGREMTADDAKFSIDRLLRPATGNEGSSIYNVLPIVGMQDVLDEKSDELAGVKVVDDLTFTIELDQPDSALPYTFTLPFAAVVPRDVVEEMGDEEFNLAPVGNGPFVLKDIDIERGLVLERFPDYWNPEYPYVDRVEWTVGTDVELAVLQVQNGEIEMIQEPPPAGTLQQLRDDPGENGELIIGPMNLEYFMNLNMTYPAFEDVRVRRAVAMALDRERLVRALKGIPTPSTGGLFTSLSPYYQEGLAIPYDPEGAKTLLAEAGAEGFDVLILGQNVAPFTEMAQTAQADLQAIGVNATAEIATPEVWIDKCYSGKNPPPMVTHLWDLPYPHGSYFMDGGFTQQSIDAGCCNVSMYSDPEFDELTTQAHLAQDPEEIADLYMQMDKKVVVDDVAAVPLFQAARTEFLAKKVKGFVVPETLTTTHFFRDYWLEEGS